ncbi:BRO family protein [Roseomonas genomospecies 6]|uniref:Bro-N domain-containing protein n=1 Tax=Roseomonas genomospecies 6 TaxID=214106 RepID=A0A9W7KQV1_9PROT|nr:BRO family protein [Roseomonas genomospecies 6]KAA0677282.1 hypothetical protein DS843_24345 [Roseomonas genomospecies 6]
MIQRRTVTGNGEMWFCVKDVAAALGVQMDATSYVKYHGIKPDEIKSYAIAKTPGRPPLFINATAVRRVAQRSNKPAIPAGLLSKVL